MNKKTQDEQAKEKTKNGNNNGNTNNDPPLHIKKNRKICFLKEANKK